MADFRPKSAMLVHVTAIMRPNDVSIQDRTCSVGVPNEVDEIANGGVERYSPSPTRSAGTVL